MTTISKIVDGKLKLTKTPDEVVTTMTKDEVIGKRAEAQTLVDHAEIDLVGLKVTVTEWDNYLKEM